MENCLSTHYHVHHLGISWFFSPRKHMAKCLACLSSFLSQLAFFSLSFSGYSTLVFAKSSSSPRFGRNPSSSLSLSSLLFCWCSSRVNPENSGQIHAILSTFFSGFFLVMYVVESTIPRSDIKVQQPPLPSLSRKSCLNKSRLLTLRFDQKKNNPLFWTQ